MTEQEKQALIVQLQQQLALLTQQLTQLNNQQSNSSWCYTFPENFGVTGYTTEQATNLHIALQRLGISYSPDSIGIFSTGTANAVSQFQGTHGISLKSGFVGPKTAAELNKLYKCTPVVCKTDWKCTSWGLCASGQQTRNCTDNKGCGVTTGKPAETQKCSKVSDISIKANGSDDPVNIFLTLGNGAVVNQDGINLTKEINLQWSGVNVASCMASDSLTPKVFSGYKASSSSQNVLMSGVIKATSSSASKLTDTFKINCVSTINGSQVSDSVVANLYYTVNSNCFPNWQCTTWGDCISSNHSRTCTDINGCGTLGNKPLEKESCTLPPVVNIKVNNSEGPVSVLSGSAISVSWTSSNVTSCIASGNWSGTKSTSGATSIPGITSNRIFTITCTGKGGSISDSVTVNIAN